MLSSRHMPVSWIVQMLQPQRNQLILNLNNNIQIHSKTDEKLLAVIENEYSSQTTECKSSDGQQKQQKQ